ncbi:signal peptidase II [Nocardia asteroides NBRC 15531]|uniref:Lipoprotein signal peptidase n=1 Tax=Nocardia asteroides NBRC 15531 TaxID=1110697 RepID=U5E7P8_NOCAS|nr:signal peptidase II [Nocardia asteroides]TLF64205.1 signal peptidase II [Nocardia asteroides NBRC 15531]UGT50693.1 signal peptidase II [Nocardia asteroides]SFN30651.1 signal peptidase II [Nocardia asteroides]VEG36478.1 Lipoprotein signal peptidase [Nocardia asteroides]GAD83330.1 lipoprotein signal peptidase [Nocardia asteroides NBRC 15531]
MTTTNPVRTDRPRLGRRIGLLAVAAGFAATDLAIKAWATGALAGAPIEAGPLDLRLAFNPGAAFSIAADAPGWVLLAVTGAITLAVAVYGWRTAPGTGLAWRLGLAAILGGASANLIDRIPDAVVTDYLHTGWWPTFNLADTFIVVGATTLVALTMFGSSHERDQLSPAD